MTNTYKFDAVKVKQDIIAWIRKFFAENGERCNAIVGISGGIDSSVVAALCVEAIGKERVVGVKMPWGIQDDIEYSEELIDYLGIKSYTMNIGCAVAGVKGQFPDEVEISKQTMINLPARIRMATLYAISQSCSGRVANTSNLSESYVGYDTRYGDSVGDFSPLYNLTKTEIRAIAKELGIPHSIIKKSPDDGLCGETDEDRFGFTYDVLDKYIRTGECDDTVVKNKIDQLHNQNLFKLSPMPTFEYIEADKSGKIVDVIELAEDETGYTVVRSYVEKYWEESIKEKAVVSLGTSYDGKRYYYFNTILDIFNECGIDYVEYLSDWWEGEKYIKILGIKGISEIDI